MINLESIGERANEIMNADYEGMGRRANEKLLDNEYWYLKWIIFSLALIGLFRVLELLFKSSGYLLMVGNNFRKYIQKKISERKQQKNTEKNINEGTTYGKKLIQNVFKMAEELAVAITHDNNEVKRTICGAHLRNPDDLVDWPKFPDGCKSLLSKHLTREIWEKYKNQTDEWGISFKSCIFSGCKNVDSSIGVYAGSNDAYKKFGELFNPIIEEYH